MDTFGRAAMRGALAGGAGSVIQSGIGLLLDRALLPRRQHNNIAPRLIKRLGQLSGRGENAPRDWTLGALFHVSYGLGWGAIMGVARRLGMPPLPLGALTGGLIYLVAFSNGGVGTRTATEPPPGMRGWRKQASLIAVAWGYAFATAYLDEMLTNS